MSLNYIASTNASISTNNAIITVAGNVDFSGIDTGYLVAINDGLYLRPALSGTAPDSNGNSTITLADVWPSAPLNNVDVFVFPTFANISSTISAMTALNDVSRGILSRFNDLLTSAESSIDIRVGATATVTTTPYQYLVDKMTSIINDAQTLAGSISAMTKAEFDIARHNELKRHSVAGLKNTDFDSMYSTSQVDGWQNTFKINANTVKINGVWHEFDNQNILLNDAPNGLQNLDLVSDDYVDLAAAIVAGGTSLSASYLNQRELVLITQEDVELEAANALSTEYIQDASNHVYSDNGILRQKVFNFVVERLPESVDRASKNNFWADTVNAMTALGWTENTVIKGQWEKGALSAAAISWVQRENKGSGHPINTQGCGRTVNTNANGWVPWYFSNARKPLTLVDCFTQYNPTAGILTGAVTAVNGYVGSVAGGNAHSGRWNGDGKYHDAIYPEQIHSLAVSAKKQDLSSMLFNSENAAVSASLRGQEGVPFMRTFGDNIYNVGATSWLKIAKTDFLGDTDSYNGTASGSGHDIGKAVDSNNSVYEIDTIYDTGTQLWLRNTTGSWPSAGTYNIVFGTSDTKHTTANPTWTDIIGTPANIAATAAELGVDGFYGTWIGMNSDVAPATGTQLYAASRKSTHSDNLGLLCVTTNDSGASFTSLTPLFNNTSVGSGSAFFIRNTSNVIALDSDFNGVAFVCYKTQANFTDAGEFNKLKLATGSVIATNHYHTALGQLVSNLLGKVATGSTNPAIWRTKLTKEIIDPQTKKYYPNVGIGFEPEHDDIGISGDSNTVKSIVNLVEIDGLHALQFTFKEMVNNGIGWGDDNKFQITDRVDTMLDENGNTVIFGTHTHILNIPAEDF